MPKKLGVVMDPIAGIHFKKDTTLALLLEAQKRNWSLYYLEPRDLYLKNGITYGRSRPLKVFNDPKRWFEFAAEAYHELHHFDVILMRKDPPFDMEYIYTTFLLEFAEQRGSLIINKPQSLRNANEKLFAQWFPECMPPTLVAKDPLLLKQFINEHHTIVLKPLHEMGGGSIFKLSKDDVNLNVAIEVLTDKGNQFVMTQQFIPEIVSGDKRIILINGYPIDYALARIPIEGEIRGNLAAGGKGVGIKLSQRDHEICEQIGPTLREKGLYFVGIDVIGDYLTEINVTSPTCVREIEASFDVNICEQFFDFVEGA
jgi:glutathione synthase